MLSDHEFEIPLIRPDARVLVRFGGRPVRDYATMLQLEIEGSWATIKLIDNHLDEHHLHRYDGLRKRQPGEHFGSGAPREVLPKAIRHLVETAESTIESWERSQ